MPWGAIGLRLDSHRFDSADSVFGLGRKQRVEQRTVGRAARGSPRKKPPQCGGFEMLAVG